MEKKFLSDTKMGRLVARLLGRNELSVKDGKVELTDDERDLIRRNYGEGFLVKLEATSFDEGSGSDEKSVREVINEYESMFGQLMDEEFFAQEQ